MFYTSHSADAYQILTFPEKVLGGITVPPRPLPMSPPLVSLFPSPLCLIQIPSNYKAAAFMSTLALYRTHRHALTANSRGVFTTEQQARETTHLTGGPSLDIAVSGTRETCRLRLHSLPEVIFKSQGFGLIVSKISELP